MIHHIALRTDNRCLDSFLYSGALFLVGMDGELTSFDWQNIVQSTLAAHGRSEFSSLFLDSRQSVSLDPQDDGREFEIPDSVLRESVTSRLNRDIWPTDFNIYANRIYISDESGAYVAPYSYSSKSIEQDSIRNIKQGYVYSIAPGDGGRLAIAGANDGLSVLDLNGQERTLVEDDIFDCDWFGVKLVANSRDHAYLASFTPLPKKESFADNREFLASMMRAKNAEPITERLDTISPGEYRWLAGEDVLEAIPHDSAPSEYLSSRVIKARSASFGSVVEYLDKLVIQRSDSRDTVDIQRPVFWRTFSRSKNYLNHLHIGNDSGMQIRAYETQDIGRDRFSVELSDFEL